VGNLARTLISSSGKLLHPERNIPSREPFLSFGVDLHPCLDEENLHIHPHELGLGHQKCLV